MVETRHISKPIPGFEGYYACAWGHIYSTKTGDMKSKTFFKAKDGYLTVGLTPTGETEQKRYKVHRIIALTWLDNPDNLPVVNHIDGDKGNNYLTNLEYVTSQQNTVHAFENGLINTKKRPVCQIDMNGNLVAEYESIRQASKITGIDNRSIQQVCANEKRYKTGEYHWVYKENYATFKLEKRPPKNSKGVVKCDKNGKILMKFESLGTAAKHMNRNPWGLKEACVNNTMWAGCYWKLVEKVKEKEKDPEEGTEDWVILPNYPSYKISKDGRIYSKKYKRILSCYKCDERKREIVSLARKDGKITRWFVHRLIALAYIPNPNNYLVVNHLDGDSLNNKVENLEWTSHSGNGQHAYDIGINTNQRKVIQLSKDDKEIKTFDSIASAARSIGVTSGSIHYSMKHNTVCRDYKWKRA